MNREIIEKNKPRLKPEVIYKGLQERMVADPAEALRRIHVYISNLLIWQKEVVIAEMFEIQKLGSQE